MVDRPLLRVPGVNLFNKPKAVEVTPPPLFSAPPLLPAFWASPTYLLEKLEGVELEEHVGGVFREVRHQGQGTGIQGSAERRVGDRHESAPGMHLRTTKTEKDAAVKNAGFVSYRFRACLYNTMMNTFLGCWLCVCLPRFLSQISLSVCVFAFSL